MATATQAETEKRQEDGSDSEKKTEPHPWTPFLAEQTSAQKNGARAHRVVRTAWMDPPENCLERLARLSTFRI